MLLLRAKEQLTKIPTTDTRKPSSGSLKKLPRHYGLCDCPCFPLRGGQKVPIIEDTVHSRCRPQKPLSWNGPDGLLPEA